MLGGKEQGKEKNGYNLFWYTGNKQKKAVPTRKGGKEKMARSHQE